MQVLRMPYNYLHEFVISEPCIAIVAVVGPWGGALATWIYERQRNKPLECFGEGLDCNTRSDESVESDPGRWTIRGTGARGCNDVKWTNPDPTKINQVKYHICARASWGGSEIVCIQSSAMPPIALVSRSFPNGLCQSAWRRAPSPQYIAIAG